MTKYFFSALVAVAMIAGCSVKGGKARGTPPNTDLDISIFKFNVVEGRLLSQMVSALVWPKNWSEAELERKVNLINKASAEVNKVTTERMLNPSIEIKKRWNLFLNNGCLSDEIIADLTEADKFSLDETRWTDDARWKKILAADPSNKPGYDLYMKAQDCRANQDRRIQLEQAIDNFQSELNNDETKDAQAKKIKEAKELLSKELGDENSIPVLSTGFVFTFASGQVTIRVNNFNNSGVTQRSNDGENQIKDVTLVKNRLWFTIPGVGDNAGTDYVFKLERIENLGSFKKKIRGDDEAVREVSVDVVQYKGDFQVKVGGQIIRNGAAQISGEFEGN